MENDQSHLINEKIICAGDLKTGADTCSGDSGGPLFQWSKPCNNYVLIGLTSWGDARCNSHVHKPGVYTRVAKHLKWIKATMAQKKLKIKMNSNESK